jgi:hypothetical protein
MTTRSGAPNCRIQGDRMLLGGNIARSAQKQSISAADHQGLGELGSLYA